MQEIKIKLLSNQDFTVCNSLYIALFYDFAKDVYREKYFSFLHLILQRT